MKHSKDASIPRHPIGVVSTRSGLAQDVLRAWERRYGAVTPTRTDTGRRLYSDADIQRLILLKRVVSAGRRISDVAKRSLKELQEMAEEDNARLSSAAEMPVVSGDFTDPKTHLSAALGAALRFDRDGLERALTEASIALSPSVVRQNVIVPLLQDIGNRWRDGEMRIAHEHLASTIVRAYLDGTRVRNGNRNGPKILVTSPEGQQHELGALMAAAAAEEVGWNAYYLGPNLPAEEIAVAAREIGANTIALSLVYKNEERHVREELVSLRRYVGAGTTIIVGGWAASHYRTTIEEIDAVLADDFPTFQEKLETIS